MQKMDFEMEGENCVEETIESKRDGVVRMSEERRFRIAMFGHKRIPSREGGIEVVVEELATQMAQRGHAVTCYNRGDHHVSGAEFDVKIRSVYQGARLKMVPTISRKGLAAVSSSFFATMCCAFGKYDVVHIHAEGPAFFCWILKLFGKRVICTVHGIDWKRAKWGRFAGRYIKCGEKAAVRYADEMIVLSEGLQKYFIDTYGRKTVLIPNGVNRPIPCSPNLIKEKVGLDKDGYVLFLGRLVPEKGITYLIEAFGRVQTDKKLVIAGGSSDTDVFMQKLKKLSDGDSRVIFTGFVQGQLLE